MTSLLTNVVKKPAIWAIAVGLAAIAAVGVALWPSGGTQAETVVLQEGPVVVGEKPLDEALAEASQRAGFNVEAPGYLPSDTKIETITVFPVAEPPGRPAASFRHVWLHLRTERGGFIVDETNEPFQSAGGGEETVYEGKEGRIYRVESEYAVSYSRVTEHRGYSIDLVKPFSLPEDEVVKLLQSLPEE